MAVQSKRKARPNLAVSLGYELCWAMALVSRLGARDGFICLIEVLYIYLYIFFIFENPFHVYFFFFFSISLSLHQDWQKG